MQRAWPRNHTYLWLQWREIWIFFYCWICTYTGTCIMSLIDFPAKRSTEPDSTPSVWLYPEGESAGQAVWYPEGEAVYEVYQQIWSPNHLLWVRWSHVSGQPSIYLCVEYTWFCLDIVYIQVLIYFQDWWVQEVMKSFFYRMVKNKSILFKV